MLYITLFLLLLSSLKSFSQANVQNKDPEIYYKNFKSDRKVANTLLIVGGSAAALGTGLALIPTDNAMKHTAAIIGGISLISGGIITSLISVPYYLSASHNKKKHKQLSPMITNKTFKGNSYIAFGLRANF